MTISSGNVSNQSAGLAVIIDTATPNAPNQPDLSAASDTGVAADDNITSDTTPTFTGSCSTGETIKVYVDNTVIGQNACPSEAIYNVTSSSLADGNHIVTTTATSIAGNESAQSTGLAITIDTTAPIKPIITSPSSTMTTNDTTPIITGTGENGTRVTIKLNGNNVTCEEGTVTVANTTWQCTPTSSWSDATYTLTAIQTDLAGNISPSSDARSVTVDTVPPPTPATPDMASSSDSGASNTDQITRQTQPHITGGCIVGYRVFLMSANVKVGEATCTTSSYAVWSATPLNDGSYSMSIVMVDPAGNLSTASTPIDITIDTTASPALTTPTLTAASDTGQSNSDSITNDTTPTFTGSCITGETIRIYSDGVQVAQVACINSTYTATSSALLDGSHLITTTTSDTAGNMSVVSSSLAITIDTTPPVAPAATQPANGQLTNNTRPVIAGTAQPGHLIAVYVDGGQINCAEGQIIAANDTTWSCTPVTALAGGSHTITSRQQDPAGNSSAVSNTRTVTIDADAPSRPARTDLVASSDSGVSNTDNITNVTTPSFTGSCSNGDTIQLKIAGITVGQQVCTNSSYTISLSSPLSNGIKAITVVAIDPAGNSSAPSLSLSVTIDTIADKPSLPDLHVDSDSGNSNTDNITNVNFPTITGTCQMNETVRVYIDNILQKTTPCIPPFLAQPIDTLTQGNHNVSIEVTDTAGNNSVRSDNLLITIDNLAPPNPLVSSPQSGVTANVTTNTYITSGTAESNAIVTVRENGSTICTTNANTNGAWSCQLTNLANGNHSYRYVATDFAGNPSSDVTTRSILVNHP